MIKDVLVHFDGGESDELRLRHAEALVAGFGGHLTGLFLNPLANLAALVPIDAGVGSAEIIVGLDEEARRQGDAIEQRLLDRLSRVSVPNELRRLDALSGELVNCAVSEARLADLFVTTRPYDDDGSSKGVDLFEAVLFESGRGTYVVPPRREPADVIRRVLVAWRDTREAARAMAEAMPLIHQAVRTAVVLVDPDLENAKNRSKSGMDVARHLDRHGTNVEVNVVESHSNPVGEVILEQAKRMSADLIVMGAYGHSRAREWVMGGATRELLERSTIPILMAH